MQLIPSRIKVMLGDFTKARSNYKKSLKLAKRYGRKVGVARSVYQLALLDMDEGDFGSAKSGLEESLNLHRDLGDERYIAASLRELGQIFFLQGNYSSAEKRLDESLMINVKINNKTGIGHCLSHQIPSGRCWPG